MLVFISRVGNLDLDHLRSFRLGKPVARICHQEYHLVVCVECAVVVILACDFAVGHYEAAFSVPLVYLERNRDQLAALI